MSLRSWDDLVIRAVILDFRRANGDQSPLRKGFASPVFLPVAGFCVGRLPRQKNRAKNIL